MERTLKMIVPTIAPESPDPFIDRLLHPARHFGHPQEVLRDSRLGLLEKRAILAAWASDACAVESMPALRKLPDAGEPIDFDAIMDALHQLVDANSAVDGVCVEPRCRRPEKLDA